MRNFCRITSIIIISFLIVNLSTNLINSTDSNTSLNSHYDEKEDFEIVDEQYEYSSSQCEPMTYEEWLKEEAPKIYTEDQLKMKIYLDELLDKDGSLKSSLIICDELYVINI